ncbi:unnamed protein product [Urochloa decumbens]|uniref:Transposase n=1 Tax=Urochloa decumbens TaxID=240449 RepID=A0ABC8VT58_9POAL
MARGIRHARNNRSAGKIKWVDDEVWPELCRYWCSQDFLKQRKRGQLARLAGLNSDDIAQNHGGSRPFIETQQVLETMYGPEKATPLNVYAVMKSGLKSVDSTGTHGAIRSNKAQKRMDDYIEGARRLARPEDGDEDHGDEGHEDMEEAGPEEDHVHDQHLNEQVLYDVSAGPRNHGRLAIGNGAIRVADVRAAAKERRVRPSNPVSMQSMAREMARLRSANARLQQENHEKDNALQHYKVTTELTLDLYRALGKEIPENALQRLSAAQAIVSIHVHFPLLHFCLKYNSSHRFISCWLRVH